MVLLICSGVGGGKAACPGKRRKSISRSQWANNVRKTKNALEDYNSNLKARIRSADPVQTCLQIIEFYQVQSLTLALGKLVVI